MTSMCSRRAGDDRQAVRQRRSEAQPSGSAFSLQSGQEIRGFVQKNSPAPIIGRQLQPAKLNCAADPDAVADSGDNETMAARR